MKKRITNNTDFYCVCCGNKNPMGVWRQVGSARESSHLKRLFCFSCKKEFNHVEILEGSHYSYNDFLFEKEHNNFDEEGNRIMPYGLFRDKMCKQGVELP